MRTAAFRAPFGEDEDRLFIGAPGGPLIPRKGQMSLSQASGRSNENVEPSPSREVTQIRPLIRCTSSRQM